LTDYEPYIADPVEPKPRPRLARFRPLVVTLILALVVSAVSFMLIRDRAEQDPSLEAPADFQDTDPDTDADDPSSP
jgi:hypothetical protein